MVELVVAFRRSLRLVALASCSMALFAIASPASAKPQHGAGRHAHAHHAGHHRHLHSHRHHRHSARASQARGFADAQAGFASNGAPGDTASYGGFGAPDRGRPKRAVPGASRARRAGSAAWRRCRRAASPTPRPASHPTPSLPPRLRGWLRFIRCRRRSAPLCRRQPDRPRPAVVRAVHEHGSGAVRPPRHRLGHGAFVRRLRPARLRPAGRRHRRHEQGARRRPCRRGQRHRRPGQSDRGVRQQRQPGQGSAGLARPDLRLRDAECRRARVQASTLSRASGASCARDVQRLRHSSFGCSTAIVSPTPMVPPAITSA